MPDIDWSEAGEFKEVDGRLVVLDFDAFDEWRRRYNGENKKE